MYKLSDKHYTLLSLSLSLSLSLPYPIELVEVCYHVHEGGIDPGLLPSQLVHA